MSRPLGQAPDLSYIPSECNAALLECDWPPLLRDFDPQGVVHMRGVASLSRDWPVPQRPKGFHDNNLSIPLDAIKVDSARRLRALRIERRVTVREVSLATGVTKSIITKYETGITDIRRADTSRAMALANFYGVSVDYLRIGNDRAA